MWCSEMYLLVSLLWCLGFWQVPHEAPDDSPDSEGCLTVMVQPQWQHRLLQLLVDPRVGGSTLEVGGCKLGELVHGDVLFSLSGKKRRGAG